MPAWPSNLPDFVLQDGYQEGFQNVVIITESDSGAKKRRRRFTRGPKKTQWRIPLTSAELDIFIAFYENDLSSGALSFTRAHPRTGATQTFAFTGPIDPPQVEGGENYIVTLPLEQLP